MNKKIGFFVLPALAVALAFSVLKSAHGQNSSAAGRPANSILRHALDIETGRVPARVNEPRLSSGVVYTLLMSSGEIQKRVAALGASAPNLATTALPSNLDANGNAYVGGVVFEINLPDSGILVEKSNAPIGGAFYHSPSPGPFQLYVDNPPGVVANDNSPNVAHDKEFIVADNNPSSPNANNVYATWTRFAVTAAGVGGDSPIYFSQSTDGGATWSKGIEISGA